MTNRKLEYWVIPPQADAEFVAGMEDVLETYEKPYDPRCPVLCMDEQPVQLLKETRTPIPATAEHGRRVDYEYERAGTTNIFMFTEPLAGWRDGERRDIHAETMALDGKSHGEPFPALGNPPSLKPVVREMNTALFPILTVMISGPVPERALMLRARTVSGDISVEGYEGNEIIIVADAPIRDADGRRELRTGMKRAWPGCRNPRRAPEACQLSVGGRTRGPTPGCSGCS